MRNRPRTYKWLDMTGGRCASSLSKSGGFVILGAKPPDRGTRPTIGHGQVVAGDIRLVSGLLTPARAGGPR